MCPYSTQNGIPRKSDFGENSSGLPKCVFHLFLSCFHLRHSFLNLLHFVIHRIGRIDQGFQTGIHFVPRIVNSAAGCLYSGAYRIADSGKRIPIGNQDQKSADA